MSDDDAKPGRPRESRDGEVRDRRLFVAVTPGEHDYAREKAEEVDISISEWLRRKAFRAYRPTQSPD